MWRLFAEDRCGGGGRRDDLCLRGLQSSFTSTDGEGGKEGKGKLRGEPFIYPTALRTLMRRYLEAVERGETPGRGPLTPRESEIVKLIAEGRSSQEIAEALVISPKTVERHRANILEKLALRDRVELTRYAIREGLIEP